MPVRLIKDITGDVQLAKDIVDDIADRLESLEQFSPQLFKFLSEYEVKVFETEGKAAGTSWPDYNESEKRYAAAKQDLLGSSNLGLLRWAPGHEYLWPAMTKMNSDKNISRFDGNKWVWGADLAYARDLETGGSATFTMGETEFTVNFPPRPFAVLSRQAESTIGEMFRDFLFGEL